MSAGTKQAWRFAKENSDQHLNIGIVGAGIAGLAAAAALIRCGHTVEVFERSKSKSEVGAALGVSPNVSGILRAMGFDYDRARGLAIKQTKIYDGPTLDVLVHADWAHVPETYGSEWYALHRADLHSELRHLATNPPEGTKPANLVFGKQVVSVDCDKGILHFADGERVEKDIVVGADGIHSAVAKSVLGDALPPVQTSGQSAFRCLTQARTMYENEITRPLFHEPKWEPNIIMKIATSSDRRIIFYPCRGGELFNFVGIHPTTVESLEDERWQGKGNVEDFVSTFESFHPALREACRHAEDLKLWKLQYRDPIKTWSKGKTVLLGDAAHPMLPHQAQAANMALEDVGAFVALLSNLTSKDEVPRRLEMVQEVRGNRTSAMQIFSNSPQDQPGQVEEKVGPYLEGRKAPKNSFEFADFIFGYDVLGAVEKKLGEGKVKA